MKKIFIFTLCLFVFNGKAYCDTILDNNSVVLNMMRAGVPAHQIKAAKAQQTRETIKDLIFAAAPCYPLDEILNLYPSSGGGSAAGGALSGEQAFFAECTQDPFLYTSFFHAMTRGHFHEGGIPYNPFEYALECQSEKFAVSDTAYLFYTPKKLFIGNAYQVDCYRISVHFDSLPYTLSESVNFKFIKKLLEKDIPLRPSKGKKITAEMRKQITIIRYLAPYLRGEIAVTDENDLKEGLRYFEKAQSYARGTGANKHIPFKIAELKLGTYQGLPAAFPEIVDEYAAVNILKTKKPSHNYNTLRLAEYYLGFLGHKINEKEGFKMIQKACEDRMVSHIAYRVWAEYHLGITNPAAYDHERANELLDQAFFASEGIAISEKHVNIRRAEIALGLYNQDSDESTDIPRAIAMFEAIAKDDPAVNLMLYRIYKGFFGADYINESRAQEIWNTFFVQNEPIILLDHATKLYTEGDVDQAMAYFEKLASYHLTGYYLGRIKSNPRYKKYYDTKAALIHYAYCIEGYQTQFRDVVPRFLKRVQQDYGASINPERGLKAACSLARSINKGNIEITEKQLKKAGFKVQKNEARDDNHLGGAGAAAPSTTTSMTTDTDDAEYSDDSEEVLEPVEIEVESREFAAAIESINEDAPIQSLKDVQLQALYDELGSGMKWRKLAKLIKGFGGAIDTDRKTIALPNSPLFTYHQPHSSDTTLKFRGYWAVLKRMIDREYEIKCQEEIEAGGAAAVAAAAAIVENSSTIRAKKECG